MRRTKCQEFIYFYLAIFLLAISGTGTSQLLDAIDASTVANSNLENIPALINGDNDEDVDVVIQNWRGLATKDNESYPVRLNMETIWTLEPDDARKLLASNASIEEVKSQTRAGDRYSILRGSIRLNNDSYHLVDIESKPLSDKSTLESSIIHRSISSSDIGDVDTIVGRLAVIISMADDREVVKGYMVIDDSKYSGNFSLLLNECLGPGPRGRGPRAGMMGR